MPKHASNADRIDQVADLVEARIRALFDEAHDTILEAINVAVEDAQDDPEGKKEATITLPISVKWNLDRQGVNITMPVTVRRKYEQIAKLDDPNQPKLPGIEGVTLESGGESVTLTEEEFEKAMAEGRAVSRKKGGGA